MDEVLQKLNLDHFIENFKEQKISGYRVQIVITRSGNSGHHEQTRCYVAQNCVFDIRRKKSNKTKFTLSCPEIFHPKSVLQSWLDEDFTIAEIASCILQDICW